jgi:hypothetical protein
LGEGIGRRGMLRPVPRWAAGGQGGRCPDRESALASRFGWRVVAAARRRPPISAIGELALVPASGATSALDQGAR